MRISATSSLTFALVFFCLFALVQSTCLKGTKCADATCTAETCTECVIGQYQTSNTWAETTCKRCPAGREYTTGNDARELECTECGAGYYQAQNDNPGRTYCNPWTGCDRAYKVSVLPDLTKNRECDACDAGMYYDTAGNTLEQCKSCPAGRRFYQARSDCKGCQAGQYQSENDATVVVTCKQCVKGKKFTSFSTACTICAAGKYQPSNGPGGAACSGCTNGRYLEDDSQDATKHDEDADCLKCAAGKFYTTAKDPCVSVIM